MKKQKNNGKSKKEYEADDLMDFICYEASIECSSCKKSEGAWGENAENDFFHNGWRATKRNVYCPECAKKKLKIQ